MDTTLAALKPELKLDGDLYQIGVVVRNLEEGMRHYSTMLGLGPYARLDTDYTGRFRDWKGRIANRNAFARWGNLYLEMIEPGIGESNAMYWLKTHGEGIFHLGYATDNLDQRPGGAGVCFESFVDGKAMVIQLETEKELGYFLELADRKLVQKLSQWIDDVHEGKGNPGKMG